jgi:hypothetical protein
MDARAAARRKNELTYIGRKCTRGHDGTRYTQSTHCVECRREAARRRTDGDKYRVSESARLGFSREIAAAQAGIRPAKPSNPQRGNGWPFGHVDKQGAHYGKTFMDHSNADMGSPGRRINEAGRYAA